MRSVFAPLAGVVLAAALPVAFAGGAQADVAAGKAVFEAEECTACHYTDGPAREKSIDDQLAKKGPELWYAGSKFQKDWLQAWLQDPQPIRPLKFNSLSEENPGEHPKLGGEEAASVSEFLMSLTSDAVEAGVIKPRRHPKGRLIFVKKMPCSGCHRYPGRGKKLSGGMSGPSLVGAKSRLNPDWIYAYLLKPRVFKPVKMMPVFVDILSERDMQKVAAYVANFGDAK
ncbi:MAG: c-type cytochrome [Gammaproteobacteria bacterium]|nr:c-type cytochrome [Gammaproteobacteria bacterium]NIT63117.1 c-type cytochrome [Gammaproteobacteria bacterium]NIW35927.1 c-type cytochrome [Gemmatimonadota bacterium]NIX10179.1 c-type cytochrome [Gammaproteobacteria bacterium]NIY31697.1 c-type cytochrome [Gammaproteobacteria bacterium]